MSNDMDKNYLAIAAIIVAVLVGGLFVGSKFGSQGSSITCTNSGASAGGLSPSLLSQGGQPESRFGATSGTQYATQGSQFNATATTTVDTNVLYVASALNRIGVNTSTNLSAALAVTSGDTAVSSSVQVGSPSEGSTQRGVLCLWNGTNFQKLWINAAGQGFSSTTAATCP